MNIITYLNRAAHYFNPLNLEEKLDDIWNPLSKLKKLDEIKTSDYILHPYLPTDVFIKHIFPKLSNDSFKSLIAVDKACFSLIHQQAVLNDLLLIRSPENRLKFALLAGTAVLKLLLISPSDGALNALAKRCHQIQSICLYEPKLGDRAICQFAYTCENLQELYLCWFKKITDKGVSAMVEMCSNLQKISFRGSKINDKQLIVLAKGTQNLKELDLSQCSKITNVGVNAILNEKANLQKLKLRHCSKLFTGRPALFQKPYPNLHELDISHLNKGHSHFNDACLTAVAKACKNLRVLELCRLRPVTDCGMTKLAENCIDLEKLDLLGCSITDLALMAIGQHSKKLHFLNLVDVDGVSQKGFDALAQGCPRLQKVRISYSLAGWISLN